MKQSASKRKSRVYPTAEEFGHGRGDKVAEALAVHTPMRRRTAASATHCGFGRSLALRRAQ